MKMKSLSGYFTGAPESINVSLVIVYLFINLRENQTLQNNIYSQQKQIKYNTLLLAEWTTTTLQTD